MTDQPDEQPKKRQLLVSVVEWAWRNAKVAAAFVGGMGTAIVLVFNAGRDYQEVQTKIEANTAEIRVLRAELRQIEIGLIGRSTGALK